MPRHSFTVLLTVILASLAAGCARDAAPTDLMPATRPTAERLDFLYRFDDPRCSADERQAIRVATQAVIGTASPSQTVAERLHFSCRETSDGWDLTVWQFGAEEVPVPGGFTGVILNRDFSVRTVVGGA